MKDDLARRLLDSRAAVQTLSEKEEFLRTAQALDWDRAKGDFWYCLRSWFRTKNEHRSGLDRLESYEPFPAHAYLKFLSEEMLRSERLVVPKSRQVMASWLTCGFILWWCLFRSAQLVIAQSKKQEDADAMLERVWGMYLRLPEWVRKRARATRKQAQIRFEDGDNTIMALPQGGSQIRLHTPSLYWADEAAFQPEFEDALAAALPALHDGGRAIITSSAAPGPMYDIVGDPEVPGSRKVVVPSWSPKNGLETWRVESGWSVARLHYSADPKKDSAWADKAAMERPYTGRDCALWQAEMEIEVDAKAGQLVYPMFDTGVHVVEPFEVPISWPVFVGIDPGWRNPCAVVFMALDGDGCWWIWDELYEREHTPAQIARKIKLKLGRRDPEAFFIGHDAAAERLDNGGKTILEQFSDAGIHCEVSYGKVRSGIEVVRELLRPKGGGVPDLRVMENCHAIKGEFRTYREKVFTTEQLTRRDPDENPEKKNDHAMDAVRFIVTRVPRNWTKRWEGKVEHVTYQNMGAIAKMHLQRSTTQQDEGGMYDG